MHTYKITKNNAEHIISLNIHSTYMYICPLVYVHTHCTCTHIYMYKHINERRVT